MKQNIFILIGLAMNVVLIVSDRFIRKIPGKVFIPLELLAIAFILFGFFRARYLQ